MDTSLTWGGIPRWMTAAGNTIDAFEKEKINAFSISAGPTRNTRGVLFWDKPYVITQKNGEKMCVLIMDTQGLWDRYTGNEINCSIIGLISLLSSCVIFNKKGNINTDELKSFSVLSKFSKDVSKDSGKPFQHLDILLRDYEDFKKKDMVDQGIELSAARLEKMRNGGIEGSIVRDIEECFREFDLFCFPSPGEDVIDADYEGVISEIKPQFMCMLSYYIDRVIRGDKGRGGIQPRQFGGETITGETFVELARE